MGIVNPFAKIIMTLTVNDQMQVEIKSELSPEQTCKILLANVIDIIFSYVNIKTQNNKDISLE